MSYKTMQISNVIYTDFNMSKSVNKYMNECLLPKFMTNTTKPIEK